MKLSISLEKYRITNGQFKSNVGDMYGAFYIPYKNNNSIQLRIIASDGQLPEYPWEHVSVSLSNRCPTWEEMCFVKDLFWDKEETVIQLHPPRSQWINNHPYCLHLWKPLNYEIILPPPETIGIK